MKSDLGDKQGAINDYNEAIRLNPGDALAYYNRGIAKSELRMTQSAIEDFREVVRLVEPNGYRYPDISIGPMLYNNALERIRQLSG